MGNRNLARRTEIRVAIGGFPYAQLQINNHLISMTYTDNEEDNADDLQLTLDDREGKWLRVWLTKNKVKLMRLDAVIVQKNWISNGRDKVLDCGSFIIDSISATGPPAKINLKATSLPYSPIRSQKKSKIWQNIKLSAVARTIGNKEKLHIIFEAAADPKYKKKRQNNEPDIVFLKRLCKAAGISLKLTGSYIVMFDAAKYEGKKTVRTIKKGSADVLTWSFSSKTADCAYKTCNVKYTEPASGVVFEGTFTPSNAPETGEILEVNEKVESNEEATKLAEKKLREKNKNGNKVSFTMVGDVNMVAGVTAKVVGWGVFDGKYIVETVSHKVTQGYVMSLTLRRVLEGY